MSKSGCLGLMISGTVFILLSLMLVSSGGTRAVGVTGTYYSTTPGAGYSDHTYPADFTYDAKLTLNAGGSGSLWLKCTDVVINQPGWGSASDMLGESQTVGVDYTVLGSSVTITIHDNYGGNYVLPVTLSGDRLSGSGTYTDISYVSNSWHMDVTKGAGSATIGFAGIGGLAGAAAVGGFLVGFAVSLLPPPRYMGGSIMPDRKSPLGTPYAPSQSLVLNHQISSMANQPGGVTRPLPDVPRMRMQFDPIQFPNVEMGRTTDIRPTDVHPTDVLSKRSCPNCGSTLMVTAGGWSCPFCNRAPPGGLDK
jgi:hypothetical protein